MRKIRLVLACFLLGISSLGLLLPVYGQEGKFDSPLTESIKGISDKVGDDVINTKGASGVVEWIERLITIAMPLIITIGIATAFVGAYKMMSSSKEDALKEGGRLIIYGIIGIVIIVSAKFLANTLVENTIKESMSTTGGLNGLVLANNLYENIFFPFIIFAAYLAMGVLFFILAARVISFLTSTDEGVRKKAGGMIAWTVIGILVIMAAKQIVEAVFGKRDEVINQNADTLGDIGTGIFATANIPIVYTVINRVMTLATLVVLVLIIFQTFQLLVKPDSPDNITKIKKTLMYVAIGVLVIGAGYIISNVLLVN